MEATRASLAAELATMYARDKRILETVCVYVGAALLSFNLACLVWRFSFAHVGYVLLSAALAIMVADLTSGVVHWAADSWGSVDMAFFGKRFIRPFREHHIDPTAITRHDFIEVNGDNFMLCIWKLARIALQHVRLDDAQLADECAWHWFFCLLGVYVALTNQARRRPIALHAHARLQIHNESTSSCPDSTTAPTTCAHTSTTVAIEMSTAQVSPHAMRYCITTGWMNGPLDALGFWRAAESLITRLTGAKPRVDDLSWARKAEPHKK